VLDKLTRVQAYRAIPVGPNSAEMIEKREVKILFTSRLFLSPPFQICLLASIQTFFQ